MSVAKIVFGAALVVAIGATPVLAQSATGGGAEDSMSSVNGTSNGGKSGGMMMKKKKMHSMHKKSMKHAM